MNVKTSWGSIIIQCLIFCFLFTACQPHVPQIHSIHPQIGAMGEPVVIKGAFFGKERGESYVTIAGAQLTSMSYMSWQDNEITLKMPESGEAGLIYVYVNGRKSNGALFTNQATLPQWVPESAARTNEPEIPPLYQNGETLPIDDDDDEDADNADNDNNDDE